MDATTVILYITSMICYTLLLSGIYVVQLLVVITKASEEKLYCIGIVLFIELILAVVLVALIGIGTVGITYAFFNI